MKKILLATTFCLAAGVATAGGPDHAVMSPEKVMADAVSSAGKSDWIIALHLLATIAMGVYL